MNKLDINVADVVIRNLSGMSKRALATEIGVSPDTIANRIKSSPLTTLFAQDLDGKYYINQSAAPLGQFPVLRVKSEFCCNNLEVTGKPSDGTLIVRSLYQYSECNGGKLCDVDDLCCMSFNKDDVGIIKPFKIGKLIQCKPYHKFDKIDKTDFPTIEFTKENVDFGDELFMLSYEPAPGCENLTALKAPESTPKPIKPQTPKYNWNASSKFISISHGLKSYNADNSHPGFAKALICLANDKITEAIELINLEPSVKRFVRGAVLIENGQLCHNGYNIKNGLTTRIIDSMMAGEKFDKYLNFFDNLMLNPSEKAVNRLFDFLEANDIEITEDGYFLAFKKVRSDFKDIYTGEIDNTPNGAIPPRVPRNQVDENDSVTCSRGLHVCSKSYLGHYGGTSNTKVVLCKVHPADAVAIPYDYKNAKMRTCGYEVIAEVK